MRKISREKEISHVEVANRKRWNGVPMIKDSFKLAIFHQSKRTEEEISETFALKSVLKIGEDPLLKSIME